MRHDAIAHERACVEREQTRAELVERWTQGWGVRIRVTVEEERLDRSRALPDLAHEMEQQCDVASAGEAVNETVEAGRVPGRVERRDEPARAWSEPGQDARETRTNRGDATVGEARRDQTDELTVSRIVKPANDSDGIAVEEATVVPSTQIL